MIIRAESSWGDLRILLGATFPKVTSSRIFQGPNIISFDLSPSSRVSVKGSLEYTARMGSSEPSHPQFDANRCERNNANNQW